MVDQFVTEKWIQLTTWYFGNRSNPRAIQMVQIPGTEMKLVQHSEGAGGMFAFGID